MGSMDEDTDANRVHFQPEELFFDLTWTGGKRPSSSVQITNPTDRPVGFSVEASDNYEVKPSRGIVLPSGTRRRINVTARGLPRVEQREGEIPVLIFHVPPDCREEEIVFPGVSRGKSPECRLAISCYVISHSVIRVRWIRPIHTLMTKVVEEVCHQNLGPALEILGEAIELRPDGFLFLIRALVNHLLGQNEEVKIDIQAAETLLPPSELDGGTGEHKNSSTAYGDISDIAKVPTYTTEKLCGKQMIVKWSEAVTEKFNQRLDVEVRFTPSVMLRPDGNVEVIVVVDFLRFEVGNSERTNTADYPEHFLQSLQIKVRPIGKWSESFSEGFGLTKYSPGNELNPLSVQRGRARSVTAGVNAGVSPTAVLQLNKNNTTGTTFHAFGFKKSRREKGHAYVCEYELRTFEDGSSAQNPRGRRIFYTTTPKIPEAVRGEVNYPNIGEDASFAGTWTVPSATAMEQRNELEFTISMEAKLPAVRKCKMFSPMHLFQPPEHEVVVRKSETRQPCVFAIARLRSFIGNSN